MYVGLSNWCPAAWIPPVGQVCGPSGFWAPPVCLVGCPPWLTPVPLENCATGTEILQNRYPAQSLQKQWTTVGDYWKETELKPLFTRVQLLCDFAPWRLLDGPGFCFSMNRTARFWAGAAVSLLCASKGTSREQPWGCWKWCWGDGMASVTTAELKQRGKQSRHLKLQL